MRGTRALLVLVIVMGALIVLGTTALVLVVVHRLTHPEAAVETRTPFPARDTAAAPLPTAALAAEPPGTRITALVRQSDAWLAMALTGGGPDRVLVWDIARNRPVAEIRLGH